MNTPPFTRRHFLGSSTALPLAAAALPLASMAHTNAATNPAAEWRNQQAGMAYRLLGRTGLMVSELVLGTYPFNDVKYLPVIEAAVERGINYIDAAPAYSNGNVEQVLGEYIAQGNRDKVFLSTKLSGFYWYLDSKVKEKLKALPKAKQQELEARAQAMMQERRIMASGYHVDYFAGQRKQFDTTYLRHVVLSECGFEPGLRAEVKQRARILLDESLKRLRTDHVDVLHIPHGIAMPEMMDGGLIQEVFQEFKQSGKARFSAVSFHNDVTANLAKVIEVGYYDAAMFAYNVVNHAGLETLMHKANRAGVGLLAMKVARPIHQKDAAPWRLDKLNRMIPDASLSKYAKAFLWALQNPDLTCCCAEMATMEQLQDNLSIVGKRVDLERV